MESLEFFKQVSVDREAGTLVWPNGVDFCPDVLYAEATGRSSDEMSGTGRRWKRGLVAVAVASCLFFVCLLPGWPISYHAPRDQLIELAFYIIFAALVYWLFSRPKIDST